ncbi:hypothetical protein HG537_0D00780 [Torulaspora globosa]|uniref:Uncharacterized protein n=1 Tax=Torulaspora globosa TaxID=48254 RepID=A0A7H9HQP6_9SACH|nr:hypothetical protein HG537_0D00780 [Torulaspora sp. CBS 2947]
MNLPLTPERQAEIGQVGSYESPRQLHSILRKPNVEIDRLSPSPTVLRPSSEGQKSVSPKSQVRFSIPDSSCVNYDRSMDESSPAVPSPSKIVFPKDADEVGDGLRAGGGMSNRGHFVDMHSRVMLDVPEEIWNFHTARKEQSNRHYRTKSLQLGNQQRQSHRSHSRGSSLQAIIVETVNSISDERGSRLAPTVLKRPELFLSPESPLNSYKMPVPLEISLPPYLSPLNKEKKKASVVFDGEGYSRFKELSSSSSDDSGSICTAEHDFSFNISQKDNSDVDKVLGFDEHANVNLKIQNKSLRKQNLSPSFPSTAKQPSQSLQVLSTPFKQIRIPDLENESQPRSANGTLKFFDEFEPSQFAVVTQEEKQIASPGKQLDELDLNFSFPNAPDSDFEKVDPSLTSVEFENRRRNLQRDSARRVEGHRHRRSRSIHNTEDMFAATSTPPRIPSRSPLRPKSPKSEKAAECSSDETDTDTRGSSSLYEENAQNIDPTLQNPAEVSCQTDLETGNETEESMRIIAERKLNAEERTKLALTDNNAAKNHLTSMHSFPEPVRPPGDTEPQSFGNVSINLLSPRRSLSNVGSQSSYNSQFSRQSPGSTATSQPPDPYAYIPFLNPVKKHNYPQHTTPRQDEKNNGFHSIYEVRDGKKVEVLVLDEDSSKDETEISSTAAQDKIPSNQQRKSVSYEEAIKNYAKILQMCEHTASEAKNVILQLIEEAPINFKNGYRPPPPAYTCGPQEVKSKNLGRIQQRKQALLNRD